MPPCCFPYSKGSVYFLRIMLLPAEDQNEPTLSPQLRSLRSHAAPQHLRRHKSLGKAWPPSSGMKTMAADSCQGPRENSELPKQRHRLLLFSLHLCSAISLSLSGHFPSQSCHRDALFQNMPQLCPCSTASLGQGIRLLPGSPRGFWHHVGTLQKEPKNGKKKNPTNQNPVHRQKVVNLKCCLN